MFTGEKQKLNMYQAITNALDLALEKDPTAGLYFHLFFKILII